MDNLIKMAGSVGMTQEQGEAAVGGIFALVKTHLSAEHFQYLTTNIPGLQDLVQKHEEGKDKASGGGGLGGMLLGAVLSSMENSSSSTGSVAHLVVFLESHGIHASQVVQYLPMVASFVEKQYGINVHHALNTQSSTESSSSAGESSNNNVGGEATQPSQSSTTVPQVSESNDIVQASVGSSANTTSLAGEASSSGESGGGGGGVASSAE